MRTLVLLALLAFSGLAHAQSAPCFPKLGWPLPVVYDAIPASAAITDGPDTYAVWVCESPTGYSTQIWLFQLADVAPFAWQYVAGNWTKAQADANCATTCRQASAAELAFMQTLAPKYWPLAVTGSTPQPVYAANADGTANTTPIAGVTVPPGTRCAEGFRLAGTQLYSVQGKTGADGQPIAAGYALCTVSFTIPPSPTGSVPTQPGILAMLAPAWHDFVKLRKF